MPRGGRPRGRDRAGGVGRHDRRDARGGSRSRAALLSDLRRRPGPCGREPRAPFESRRGSGLLIARGGVARGLSMVSSTSLGSVTGSRRAARLLCAAACALFAMRASQAQVRGVYPLGMSGTGSGITPEPGFTYSNQFIFYARDELRGPDGEVTARGHNSVIMDLNSFVWVWKKEILGGARFSMSATLPIANNSLSSDVTGAISGGGGFADAYYQPFILGWNKERFAVRAVYGFLAPTGRFSADATDNVGSGYWTQAVSSGQTFFLTRSKSTILSTFEMYEVHAEQEDTDIQPGD